MKKTFFILALALMLGFSFVTSSSAWTYVPSYGETGWQSFSFSSTQAAGAWDGGATLTFGVVDSLDTALNSVLLIDNVKATCNYGGVYTHFADSFESGLTSWTPDAGFGSVSTVASAVSSGSNTYSPTDGTLMAQMVSTKEMTSVGFVMHGSDISGSFGPTTITFDWAFLAMDYTPFDDYSFAKLTYSDGSSEYFELGKIASVPEPTTMLLLGLGLIGLAGLRKKF